MAAGGGAHSTVLLGGRVREEEVEDGEDTYQMISISIYSNRILLRALKAYD